MLCIENVWENGKWKNKTDVEKIDIIIKGIIILYQ
jgi:hypothetical protein